MKEKFQRFMIGRYGADELSKFMLGISFVLIILSLFIRSSIINTLIIAIMVLLYFRMFSRNIQGRYGENQKFLQMKGKVLGKFQNGKSRIEQSKTHHIYGCPKCKQKIRIPKGKGKLSITCPKCGEVFIKKS